MTETLRVNPINPEPEKIARAAEVILKGGTVAFPTETVYGIGANAFDESACAGIFKAKGRPSDNPLIVHISKAGQLKDVADGIDQELREAVKTLWPGPVSFVLKSNGNVPLNVRGGLDTVAVRMPAHPIALRLIEKCGTPIAAPSANLSGRPSSTTARHVIEDLDGRVDLIIDGGDTAFGLESTVINATEKPYVLLRPGAFTLEELQKYLGEITVPESIMREIGASERALSPGMRHRHYSPKTRVVAVSSKETIIRCANEGIGRKLAILCSNELAEEIESRYPVIIKLGPEGSLYEVAKNLFDSLRKLDGMNVDAAIVQCFPERGIGLAIMNRIIRASGSAPAGSLAELKRML